MTSGFTRRAGKTKPIRAPMGLEIVAIDVAKTV